MKLNERKFTNEGKKINLKLFISCVFVIKSIDEGVYNTYIIDTDYREWALIMHCAEKPKSNRYLSALMLSRTPTIGVNVINFLRFDISSHSYIGLIEKKKKKSNVFLVFFESPGKSCRNMTSIHHLCFK